MCYYIVSERTFQLILVKTFALDYAIGLIVA